MPEQPSIRTINQEFYVLFTCKFINLCVLKNSSWAKTIQVSYLSKACCPKELNGTTFCLPPTPCLQFGGLLHSAHYLSQMLYAPNLRGDWLGKGVGQEEREKTKGNPKTTLGKRLPCILTSLVSWRFQHMLLSSLHSVYSCISHRWRKATKWNSEGFPETIIALGTYTWHLVKHQLHPDFLGALSTRTEVSTPFL